MNLNELRTLATSQKLEVPTSSPALTTEELKTKVAERVAHLTQEEIADGVTPDSIRMLFELRNRADS